MPLISPLPLDVKFGVLNHRITEPPEKAVLQSLKAGIRLFPRIDRLAEIVVPNAPLRQIDSSMGNLFSSGRALQLSIVGFITLVGWVARAKIWRKKAVPSQATNLVPEWQDLFHRNYYGRRRLQMVPNSDRQNMLRDFVLISMRDSPNCVNRVCRSSLVGSTFCD
jgi:hypothetical protein